MAESSALSRNGLKNVQNSHDHSERKLSSSKFPKPEIEENMKKNQVINLESSQEKELPNRPESLPGNAHQQTIPPAKVKPKKTTFKCQLCKGAGKKAQMKNCANCKLFFHINCLEENEVKRKYTCDRCRIDCVGQTKALKKHKKLDEKYEKEVDKAVLKKIQKQRKKDECHRTLEVFKQKYPYYMGEDNKIKYPIQDKLLFIYKEYFEPSEFKPAPVNHPFIPSKYVGDFLQLENFLTSFRDQIAPFYGGEERKAFLYILMNCNGSDYTFQALIGAIVRIYLKDIYEKNKTQNIKILNENCFFIILGSLNEIDGLDQNYLAAICPEIIRYLSIVPSMRKAFQYFQFSQILNLDTKLKIIMNLLQGLSQVDSFHDMVSRKSEKMSQMTKEKANLISKLKKDEAEALSNKQKLKQMLTNIADKEQSGKVNEDPKSLKQLQKKKKKTIKMSSQKEQSQICIKQFKDKIIKISRMIPFAISEIMFLGTDRNKSSYFFFLREPNRIYVRYHNFLLDNSLEYKLFEGKDKIIEVFKSLNTKGINEKHLHQSISFLLKQQIIRNLTFEEQNKELAGIECQFQLSNQVLPDSEFREKIVKQIIQIEQNFSNYLAMRNCQWASQSKRDDFMLGFSYIQDISALKQSIRTLQQQFLFVEVVKQKQLLIRESDSNNEQKDNLYIEKQRQLSKRKKPIRLWGMNAEKIKKYWTQYLEQTKSFIGIWICTIILKSYVKKYLDKKLQTLREQQRKEKMERQRQQRERQNKRQKQLRQRERQLQREREYERITDKKERMGLKKRNREVSFIDLNEVSNSEPQGGRILRKSTRKRNKTLTIDSDENEEISSQSNEDDQCGICGEVGDMVCCDTCPKVFHLECVKLKQVPEGEWSCLSCLQRISNQRQTRSKMRRLNH